MKRPSLKLILVYVVPALLALYFTMFAALSWMGQYAEIQTSDPYPDPQGGYAGYQVWHLYGTYVKDWNPVVGSLINVRSNSSLASVIEVIFKPLITIVRCHWHPTALGNRYFLNAAPKDLSSGADWGYGCN